MDLGDYGPDYVVATLSKEELLLIDNALTDVLNGIDPDEFQTRMGGTQHEIERLCTDIRSVLRQMQ